MKNKKIVYRQLPRSRMLSLREFNEGDLLEIRKVQKENSEGYNENFEQVELKT